MENAELRGSPAGTSRATRCLAAELVIGAATVKTHVANLLGKLGLRDRTQAVVSAYESGARAPGDQAPPNGVAPLC